MDINQKLTEELDVNRWQIDAAVTLIDEGNTIPFISRYRKEATGSLNDEQLRKLHERLLYLRNLEEKKMQVLSTIEEQGKLTDDLRRAMMTVRERMGSQMPPPMSAFEGIVGREPYPVADKAGELLSRLMRLGVTRFRSLFQGNRSRSEVVATFIAVLELCKAKRIRLAGTDEDCTVTCTGEGEAELEFSTDAY